VTELVKYDAACRAVAEAASIDEAKDLRDKGEAMRAYARQAKNKDLEIKAAEIRIRAERRIGELMAAQRETEGLNKGAATRVAEKPASPPTLAEAGIDKNLADRARKLAAIPEEEFNGIVGEWKERVEAENARVTVNLLAAGEKAQADEPPAAARPDPYGYAKLTEAALLDLADGLRAELDEAKARIRKQTGEIADLKMRVKELAESSDLGPVVSNLHAQVARLKDARDEKQTLLAKETRRANFFEAEVAKLRAQLENRVEVL
jgi:hypothetical protein